MPELPEVEVLVRYLRPLLQGKQIVEVHVRRPRVLGSTPLKTLRRALRGAKFAGLTRRGKYLLFSLRRPGQEQATLLLGHLGMTGRMYLAPPQAPLPKHASVVMELGRENFIFEDTRYFGRLTLDLRALDHLGPEPLGVEFSAEQLGHKLAGSKQGIKQKLLDQSVVAGIGNIYASEALFQAGISPRKPASRLALAQLRRLWRAVRQVLREAIRCGSTVRLDYAGAGERDGLFYFGRAPGSPASYQERLRVYDRAGQPCLRCGASIRREVQAARSTYYCPRCQRR